MGGAYAELGAQAQVDERGQHEGEWHRAEHADQRDEVIELARAVDGRGAREAYEPKPRRVRVGLGLGLSRGVRFGVRVRVRSLALPLTLTLNPRL